jgi:tetratricopeptide (TPR) repeat protein
MGKDKTLPLALLSLCLAIIVCAAAFESAAGQQTGQTVRHHRVEEQDPAAAILTEAENDIGTNNFANAEPLLKKYLETYPESYAAWYDLGFVYHALGRNQDSIAAYKKSIAAKPGIFESNLNLGLVLADAGEPQAEQYLRAATTLQPNSNSSRGQERAWMALGHVLANKRPEDAIAAFKQAEAAAPNDPEPHLAAGSILERQQNSDEAEKQYQQAASLAPQSSDPLIALGNFYMRERRFSDAEAPLKKLVTLHPTDAGAHFQLGRMLAISGNKKDAATEMEAGLKLDPSDMKAQRDLADMYTDSGKYEEAGQLYAALLNKYPQDANLHFGLGRTLLKEKHPAEAEQELMKATQLKPGWGEAYGELAVAANENKNYPLAIKAADERAKYLPENPMSYFLRATAYDHLRDAKNAARYYHQFLDAAEGKYPDQEWQAQHRLIAIEPKK